MRIGVPSMTLFFRFLVCAPAFHNRLHPYSPAITSIRRRQSDQLSSRIGHRTELGRYVISCFVLISSFFSRLNDAREGDEEKISGGLSRNPNWIFSYYPNGNIELLEEAFLFEDAVDRRSRFVRKLLAKDADDLLVRNTVLPEALSRLDQVGVPLSLLRGGQDGLFVTGDQSGLEPA